ncbi:hypothetical protein EW145_g7231 [Phellinidium pouzarii]|uniref:Uncharacterized protein n=1 Tax=Phellinidium pouzarii TaxID=167371 RepID=A0A4S4KN92_9AGAM|nr:hypothetical protein EW145_g7231 [Phellinidium pouzarii]
MSTDSSEADSTQLPAISALRSKFEKLAQDTSTSSLAAPSRPAAATASSTSTRALDSSDLLSPVSNRQRALSNSYADVEAPVPIQLRPSSSSSDLKLARRPPPPPPPPTRSPKPYLHPPLHPVPASTSSPPVSAASGLDKQVLTSRKPPPAASRES